MINYLDLVYAENEIELLGPIKHGAVCYQNETGQQHDQQYRLSL